MVRSRGGWARKEKCTQNKLGRETRGKETTCEMALIYVHTVFVT